MKMLFDAGNYPGKAVSLVLHTKAIFLEAAQCICAVNQVLLSHSRNSNNHHSPVCLVAAELATALALCKCCTSLSVYLILTRDSLV